MKMEDGVKWLKIRNLWTYRVLLNFSSFLAILGLLEIVNQVLVLGQLLVGLIESGLQAAARGEYVAKAAAAPELE